MSLAVFVVSLSGIIAMQSRSFEARASAKYVREGERLAQRLMAESQASGFSDLVNKKFDGSAGALPNLGDDLGLFAYGERPYDRADGAIDAGSKPGFYRAFREVRQVMFDDSAAAGSKPELADAITIDIYVLWIDDSNSSYTPPAKFKMSDLTIGHIQAGNANFKPWVQGVHLRTVKLNDI